MISARASNQDVAQGAPVLRVVVDDHGHLGIVQQVPDAFELAGAYPFGLEVDCRVKGVAVKGVAYGDDMGPPDASAVARRATLRELTKDASRASIRQQAPPRISVPTRPALRAG